MAEGDNYCDFTARAGSPSNDGQHVSVSGKVLVDPGVSPSLSQTEEEGGSESALFLQLNLSDGDGSDGPQVWAPVSFDRQVELQEGNPITEVEITSEQLGDYTVKVDSPGGGLE